MATFQITQQTERISETTAGRGGPVGRQVREELALAVGVTHVLHDSEDRRRYGLTTLSEGTVPAIVVRPREVAEVQEVLRIAKRHALAVYPISTGRNWGYGDACAPGHGQLLLDLSRMNRILEVNTELAYARIEPGVTQGQLAAHLESLGDRLRVDATGAGPEASLIGNTLERGIGHTPHGDRIAQACNFEVVLPDGQLLHTGFGHYAAARNAHCYAHGVGPSLDGLFAQSSLGIVTKLTVWLMPRPEAFQAFFFGLRRAEDIGALLEALRPLRQAGTLRTAIHIFNDLRLLACLEAYPWDEADGTVPLPAPLRERLCRRHGLDPWTGSGALYGSREEVAAAARTVRRVLGRLSGLRRLHFMDERRLAFIRRLAGWLGRTGLAPGLPRLAGKLEVGFRLLQGRPHPGSLQGSAWRVWPASQETQATDPLALGAGFYWVAPVVPLTAWDSARVNDLAAGILGRHGFDLQVTLSLVTPRALCAIISITFCRNRPGEAARARRCHDELVSVLLKCGYPPYRAGLQTVPLLGAGSEGFFEVVRRLKDCLDPDAVLAPGRYDPCCEGATFAS